MAKLIRIFRLMKTPKIFYRKIVHQLPLQNLRKKLLPFPDIAEITTQIDHMLNKANKKKPVILFPGPSCPWGYMFQRPQQLARALSKKGYTVIYLVNTDFVYSPDWDVRGVFEIERNLFLYNDNLNGTLLRHGLESHKVLIWQYWPHQRKNIAEITKGNNNIIKIYDCIDHISTFDNYSLIEKDHENSLRDADLVLATASAIQVQLREYKIDALLVPNAVNIGDFKDFKKTEIPHLKNITNNSTIIIGYYGAIADWFDFDTLEYIAGKNPKWTFLIIGEVYTEVIYRANRLKKYENVKFVPRVPYEQIPQILSLFDIAILPFKLNDITNNTSPVKVYEYLAGGKPIVSSDLPELRKISSVLIATGLEDFNKKIHEAILIKGKPNFKQKVKEAAEEHTWTKRVEIVMKRVEEL